ncbi:MAG: hypothetical protein NTY12_04735 [Candidatus Falkowbacteria bacterium]|nr:hypothetical protein [Candidatus Falkowbacteria bacterium]
MEIKAFVREIDDQELNLETETKTRIIIPKAMLPDAKIDQVVYVSCALEPDKLARETLNELLSNND